MTVVVVVVYLLHSTMTHRWLEKTLDLDGWILTIRHGVLYIRKNPAVDTVNFPVVGQMKKFLILILSSVSNLKNAFSEKSSDSKTYITILQYINKIS